MRLGELMREKRGESSVSVKELAIFLGVSGVYVTNIEKHGKLPSVSVMYKIYDFFGSKEMLMSYVDEKYGMVLNMLAVIYDGDIRSLITKGI